MNRTGYALLLLGFMFGFGVSLVFHCKLDITSVVVAAVAACPILLGQILNYNLSKSNRFLIYNMHEQNIQRLETINNEVKKNGNDGQPNQA